MNLYSKQMFAIFNSISWFSMFFLLFTFWIVGFTELLYVVLEKNLSIKDVAMLSILILPSLMYSVLPFAFFVGLLVISRKIFNNSIVLKANGIEDKTILTPFWATSLLILACQITLSFWVVPAVSKQLFFSQVNIRNNILYSLIKENEVSNVKSNFIFLHSFNEDKNFENLLSMWGSGNNGIYINASKGSIVFNSMYSHSTMENATSLTSNKDDYNISRFENIELSQLIPDAIRSNAIIKGSENPETNNIFELFEKAFDPYQTMQVEYQENFLYRIMWSFCSFFMIINTAILIVQSNYKRGGGVRYFKICIMGAYLTVFGMSFHRYILGFTEFHIAIMISFLFIFANMMYTIYKCGLLTPRGIKYHGMYEKIYNIT